MQVILTKDVDSLGESGEVLTVKDGFARNYLLPNGLAQLATDGALEDLQRRIERIKAKAEKKHQEDLTRAKKIEGIGVLTLTARAGEGGKLFGAVTTKELSKLVAEKTKMDIDRKALKLDHPINHLGEYSLQIKLSPKVTASLQIKVEGDDDSPLG